MASVQKAAAAPVARWVRLRCSCRSELVITLSHCEVRARQRNGVLREDEAAVVAGAWQYGQRLTLRLIDFLWQDDEEVGSWELHHCPSAVMVVVAGGNQLAPSEGPIGIGTGAGHVQWPDRHRECGGRWQRRVAAAASRAEDPVPPPAVELSAPPPPQAVQRDSSALRNRARKHRPRGLVSTLGAAITPIIGLPRNVGLYREECVLSGSIGAREKRTELHGRRND